MRAAIDAFATDGPTVPIHEIARRAGVGTGTVSRHFPTKESLYEAIVQSVAKRLVSRATELRATREAGPALFEFLASMAAEGATNRALADALSGTGFDIAAAAAKGEHDLNHVLTELLSAAQRAGAVRPDVDAADLKAFLVGCAVRERDAAAPAARDRMLTIVRDGLSTVRRP
ncbi:TetR/AcrR family transcriptional regulator [Micromonospora sp. NPDC049175]|uniref:TetR/AcrR family transcriptional regulator n=1 Tax=unclassified Micromonospora TaxID=2617518 RepID=UPI00371DBF31